ncbi:uncharacterized protein MYCGRDRAFT_90509 [Zymoseptoria tritici IPO323]|uniref:PiggyBac transposable element-derived protein domain-containing protein n=1 Tax=Zymoseptoria tritici (strain CBS 115943 / IPO323) TaxID=336722 RepID=F9X233_ZYMTI|nr:uncharacterized protein MYCGRDRAFT_90509 [Zymoseptoria tritici IPO323]EGP89785.1 hypothetical protein MYCGRDRAFT_90509 [Zymoseptoria tritici IPO323]
MDDIVYYNPNEGSSSDEAKSSDEEAFEEAFKGVFEDEFNKAGSSVEVEERPERVPLKEPEGGGNIVVDEKDYSLCEPVDTEPRGGRFEPLLSEAHERVVKPVAVVGGNDEDIPKAFFSAFFNQSVYERIATCTNLYAASKPKWNETGQTRVYGNAFKPVTAAKIKQIKAALHLEDPSSTPSVSLDEVLIRFTGRSFHVVNMRGKPTPIGYYILALCERGYLLGWSYFSPNKKLGHKDLGVEIAGVVRPREVTIAKAQKAAKKVVVKRKKKDNSTRNKVVAAPAAPAAATPPPPPPLLPNPDDSVNLTSELADRLKAVLVQFLTTGYTIDERVNRLRRKPRPVNAFIREHVRLHWQEAREHKLVPLVAAHYNDYIGGVDIHDQLRSYCSTQHKANKP